MNMTRFAQWLCRSVVGLLSKCNYLTRLHYTSDICVCAHGWTPIESARSMEHIPSRPPKTEMTIRLGMGIDRLAQGTGGKKITEQNSASSRRVLTYFASGSCPSRCACAHEFIDLRLDRRWHRCLVHTVAQQDAARLAGWPDINWFAHWTHTAHSTPNDNSCCMLLHRFIAVHIELVLFGRTHGKLMRRKPNTERTTHNRKFEKKKLKIHRNQ